MDVKTLCLGALTSGDRSGYEIKKLFGEAFSHFFVAGYGSIYPALAELAAAGLVTCTSVEQEKRPHKKVYSLTEEGRRVLVRELVATPPRHKVRSEFLVLMFFAHLMPQERVGQVIDEMVAQWGDVLIEVAACGDDPEARGRLSPGMRFTIGYARAVLGAARDYARGQKQTLLEELAAAADDAAGRAAAE